MTLSDYPRFVHPESVPVCAFLHDHATGASIGASIGVSIGASIGAFIGASIGAAIGASNGTSKKLRPPLSLGFTDA